MTEMNLSDRCQSRSLYIWSLALGSHQHTAVPIREFTGIEVCGTNLGIENREGKRLMTVFGIPYRCSHLFVVSLCLVSSPIREIGAVEFFCGDG